MSKWVLLLLVVLSIELVVSTGSRRFGRYEDYEMNWKLIPRSVPLMNELKHPYGDVMPDDYFKFIPTYIGSVTPGNPLVWNTSCFDKNVASLSVSGNKSASMVIQTTHKNSLLCDDVYLFGYVGAFDVTYFEIPFWNHHVNWNGGWNDALMYDLNTHGIRVFKFPDGVTASVEEIFETTMLFLGAMIGARVPSWTAEDNLKFLKDHMNVEMPERKITNVNIPKTEVQSGDFMGIIRLDGLDPMLSWGMGSRTGHTAITMWIDNELFVCESTSTTPYWSTNGIQKTPWDEWLKRADAASFNVVHIPLSPENAKKFNTSAAIKFFESVEGLPYGFHNLFTGWVDTAEDNYPPPLSSHLVMLLAPFGEWLLQKELQTGKTFDFITQGLNHRLNTKGLTMEDTFMYAHKKGISFTELVTMPEQDSWIFENDPPLKNGPSMVCDVFVTRMWKAGGLFGELVNSFQATEFTDWDAYTLNLFNSNYQRPKQCVEADPDSKFCQLLGKYRLDIPDYNTVKPYPNMREKCPTLPPLYDKPVGC